MQTRLEKINGGLNVKDFENQLNDTQSPYMLNLNADDRGTLTKRKGQSILETFGTNINGLAYFKDKLIVASNTKLYTYTTSKTEIYSGLTDAPITLFEFNSILYGINGHEFIQCDGTTVKNVTENAYIPTVTISRKPDGTTTSNNEGINLLTGQFKDSFSSDGTQEYQLSIKALTSIDKVTINGVESTDFTKDLVNGKVHLNTAIAPGTPNNVIIQATFNNTVLNQILHCSKAVEYDQRVFLYGSSDKPQIYYWGGLTDNQQANYFPALNFNNLGTSSAKITNAVCQYNKLIMFKEDSIYTIVKNNDLFVVTLLNGSVGCDTATVQLINNNPVFLNSHTGVYMIVSTMLADEKNVIHISENVDGAETRPGLLAENLSNATATDHDGKYYVCANGNCYVWDYILNGDYRKPYNLIWFKYSNINADIWLRYNGDIIYGHNGNLIQFISAYNDFGQPINAVWRSKLFNFDVPEWLKTVTQIWFSSRGGGTITIKYLSENGDVLDSKEIKTSSFSWDKFSWSKFSWAVYRFAITVKRKTNVKKVNHFQIEFSNNVYNENLSILSLIIDYILAKKVK